MQPGTAAQDARRQEPIDQSVSWLSWLPHTEAFGNSTQRSRKNVDSTLLLHLLFLGFFYLVFSVACVIVIVPGSVLVTRTELPAVFFTAHNN